MSLGSCCVRKITRTSINSARAGRYEVRPGKTHESLGKRPDCARRFPNYGNSIVPVGYGGKRSDEDDGPDEHSIRREPDEKLRPCTRGSPLTGLLRRFGRTVRYDGT